MNKVAAAGLIDKTNTAGTPIPNTIQDFEIVFANILRAAIPFAGIVLFGILMLAGVYWIAAGADQKKAESARNMATYGVLGLAALAFSFLILRIIAAFLGVNSILNFSLFVQ